MGIELLKCDGIDSSSSSSSSSSAKDHSIYRLNLCVQIETSREVERKRCGVGLIVKVQAECHIGDWEKVGKEASEERRVGFPKEKRKE